MRQEHSGQIQVGRGFPLALCLIGAGMLFPACSSSGLGHSTDGSSHSDSGMGGAGGTSGTGGVTSSGGSTRSGGTTSSGGTTTSGGTTGAGGSTRTGDATGAAGGTTSSTPNCAMVGCSEPPLCSVGCTAPCGCCSCGVGERRGDLICTKSGCYASAVAPDAAGPDQAVDTPQADAPRAGAGGSGGTTGTGGSTRTGGASATGGTTTSSPADAGLDGRVQVDAAANSCENPLPLRCGDRLNHNTLVQGRPNVWNGYGSTERWMSGPEAIYFLEPPAGCQAVVQLKNHSADLVLFMLSRCDSFSPPSAPVADQPTFVVVDGYNGDWGTYTLQVDCTCNPDAGTSDAPPADAQRGTAIAPGCDLDVAWKAIAAAGLKAVGFPQTLNDTLPATLATDANWSLKATVCQQGGYDITPLAGKSICLLEQDITQRCQGNPASVSVLMDNGAVACVYKTVRKGFGAAPGVYSATSPNCTQPTLAAGTAVFCGPLSCGGATAPCCPPLTSITTTFTCDLRCKVPITCDGPEVCSNGSVCCSLESAAGFAGASCVNPSECISPSRVICHQQADCPSPQQCAVPNPMPAYLPESYDPTLQPYSLWAVSFKVCAP